jgi:hypothetical protein
MEISTVIFGDAIIMFLIAFLQSANGVNNNMTFSFAFITMFLFGILLLSQVGKTEDSLYKITYSEQEKK